jgi:glutamate racemase
MTADSRPIGVFDSGIGGLTVVRELAHRLPNESIVYFGDTARVPYGSKSAETVRRYAQEASAFLVSRDVKMIVIACNTATAHAGDLLVRTLDIPVLGVIEPGARAAVAATSTGRVGVIGTAGTIGSGAYDLAVRRQLATARVIAAEYLRPLREMDVDVLILGCTHYPLLRPLVGEIMGPDVALVDSAAETAREVEDTLDRLGLRRREAAPPEHAFIASDSPLRFRDVGRTFVGDMLRHVERVDVEGYGRAA